MKVKNKKIKTQKTAMSAAILCLSVTLQTVSVML